MEVKIFEKNTNGLPSSTEVDTFAFLGGNDPTARLQGLSQTWATLWGPKDARLVISGTVADAFMMASQWLGNKVEFWSPRQNQTWEGMVWGVKFRAGGRARSRSLESFATRARILYQKMNWSTLPPENLGPAASEWDDTLLQGVWGIIEAQENKGQMAIPDASAAAIQLLALRKAMLWHPEPVTLGRTAGSETTQIDLQLVGYWRTLFYQAYNKVDTVGTGDVRTIITTALAAKAPFISTTTDLMATTGVTTGWWTDGYLTVGEYIKRLLGIADGYTFQLGYGRLPILKAHSRTSSTITYTEGLDGVIRDYATNAEIPRWDVRPDAILEQTDFVPGSSALGTALDGVQNVYLSEVTYTAPDGLSYKPATLGTGGVAKL